MDNRHLVVGALCAVLEIEAFDSPVVVSTLPMLGSIPNSASTMV